MTMQLNPTKLGDKSYWDSVYEEERQNFDQFGDEGEIWFGQESVDKMVQWAIEHVPPGGDSGSRDGPFILDIGTGNGILCLSLVEEGYNPQTIMGIDYSEASVQLSEQIAKSREVEGLTFKVVDFVHGKTPNLHGQDGEACWDLLLDKGTYDAMALSADPGSGQEHPTSLYPSRVTALLKPGGFFLITSCNFTEQEIENYFTSKEPSLKYHSRVRHPTYTFGGKSGSICSTIAFRKE
ncbi:hypothetical protein FS842_009467 [Serendipita sp. 407]|nr:hypothetical protein FS842_009467 [Serendipita sp. 407]